MRQNNDRKTTPKCFGVVFILREWLELFDCFSATKTALPKMRQVGTAGTALPNLQQVGHD
ncbi:hypothetical protein HMPREF2898_03035 [Atopobium sp. HMSC064B08]|nr:hypothetical protein HMPREF2898_03035 [Atopobium sp. HMSC064B08]